MFCELRARERLRRGWCICWKLPATSRLRIHQCAPSQEDAEEDLMLLATCGVLRNRPEVQTVGRWVLVMRSIDRSSPVP